MMVLPLQQISATCIYKVLVCIFKAHKFHRMALNLSRAIEHSVNENSKQLEA